ncbi:hypothetical protein WH47_12219, partial [Habropoda laboriosa]
KNICDVYGENAVNKRTIQKWIERFNSGDFNVESKKKTKWQAKGDRRKIVLNKIQSTQLERLQT